MGKSGAPKPKLPIIGINLTGGLLDFASSAGASTYENKTKAKAEIELGLQPLLRAATQNDLLLYIEYLHEKIATLDNTVRKTRGRPVTVFSGMDVDAKRAWIIWWYIRQQRASGSHDASALTVSQLVNRVRKFPGGEALFPIHMASEARLASSVANGKKKLGISKDWVSETCEKFLPFNRNI